MKTFGREPLVHFLLLGAVLFIAYGLVSKPGPTDGPGKITVTQGQIENLVSGFAKAWQRPPTSEELAGLVRDLVREEVYCREAMTLGLDKDDTVIRRRLRQKMEFISDDIAAMPEPTDADLNAYLQAHKARFRSEQTFTFTQVYLDPEKHGENLARDIAALLARLNRTGGQAAPARHRQRGAQLGGVKRRRGQFSRTAQRQGCGIRDRQDVPGGFAISQRAAQGD